MVRFETVEVTKEIMKNMAKKPRNLRQSQRSNSAKKRAAVSTESSWSSPAGSSSPSSNSSSSCSSDLSGGEEASSQHSPRGGHSPVYCMMTTIPHIEDEHEGMSQDSSDGGGSSGAVQALTEVARASCFSLFMSSKLQPPRCLFLSSELHCCPSGSWIIFGSEDLSQKGGLNVVLVWQLLCLSISAFSSRSSFTECFSFSLLRLSCVSQSRWKAGLDG
ncbi:hypothetical protein XENOCAPTIV_012734 [Xenoophorus captivus]|uniref:Uncharacterized protein n=1 Tax=Xenoophorus captivus TaxID=1517983 RepID=A0ABV0R3J7_9TELE